MTPMDIAAKIPGKILTAYGSDFSSGRRYCFDKQPLIKFAQFSRSFA